MIKAHDLKNQQNYYDCHNMKFLACLLTSYWSIKDLFGQKQRKGVLF